MIPKHLIPDFDPLPDPEAVVNGANYRVTVLTSRLLRIEYNSLDQFEDRPSQPFWFRRHPVPEFVSSIKHFVMQGMRQAVLELETSNLFLSIVLGKSPRPDTFSIQLKSIGHTWHYLDENPGNLKGTYRTLDERDGGVNLEDGLISRDGWSLVDDSKSLVFNEDGWLVNRGSHGDTKDPQSESLDLYFFGYGHDYQDCIRDFRALTGPVPLLPRWALGNWWSRYWAYRQSDIIALIQEFQDHEVPLSVIIIDMDWHLTETGNDSSGWTGYTWNKKLFPDPPTMIRHIHERGLKTALNLHPAAGIHDHETQYEDFARHMGVDPASRDPIPFDLADPRFTTAYFEFLHHPKEEDGLDFWWIDWQQGSLSSLPGLDPLFWLNHLHFLDMTRPRDDQAGFGKTRPFIFSRWGGLGNHRYPIGFSGDTIVSWESLAYQPYFTATAANVSYGWWSHDIGGHMGGIEDPELYTRWVQYGLLSPIFRLHSTKIPFHERRPYAFDAEISRLTSHAMRLRHSFIPYLYTMAWRDHQDAISPLRPLYHLEPETDAAYHAPDTYTFGSELVAAPHLEPMDPDTRLSRRVVWLPEGDWYKFFTGEHYPGGHQVVYGDLADIPLFAKAGAIVPKAPMQPWGGTEPPTHLKVHVFPGAENNFLLYDDDGCTNEYLGGRACALTPMALKSAEDGLEFSIGPVIGDLEQSPKARTYEVKFWGVLEPDSSELIINQEPAPLFPEYDPEELKFICPIELDISNGDEVLLRLLKEGGLYPDELALETQTLETCKCLVNHFRLETFTKNGLFESLPEVIKNPASLVRLRPRIRDAQLRALLETITRTGIQRDNRSGRDQIILWGNQNPIQDIFPVTYQLSVNQVYRGYYDHPYHHEGGPVPDFMVYYPQTHFGDNPWELRVMYGDVLTVRLTSEDA